MESAMTTVPTPADFDDLRRHVRGTQHARSYPLLVMGALLVNYAVAGFLQSAPVQWRYGAPLAFVLVWGLGKFNEQSTGVGAARGEYLVAGGCVFIATNLLLLLTRFSGGTDFHELVGLWVVIVGVGLAAVSRAGRDPVIASAGAVIVITGIVMAAFGSVDPIAASTWWVFVRSWSVVLIALTGAALGVAGLLLYRGERAEQ
jgi:hypothetical protein